MKNKKFPKARFIYLIKDASEEDKERYISFFISHRDYESKIDWNNKKQLTKAVFEKLISDYEDTKRISYQFENSDFSIIGENEDYLFVQILTYNGAVYVNSFDCGGQGARWCTGDSFIIQKWIDVVSKAHFLVLVYNKAEVVGENERKYIIEYCTYKKKLIAHFQDDDPLKRIYDRDVIKKFRPPFNFRKYPFVDVRNGVYDLWKNTQLLFLDGYQDYFDDEGIHDIHNNVVVELTSRPREYYNLTVNDMIFLIIKYMDEQKLKNPLRIKISADIEDPIIFETDFGTFYFDVQLYNDYILKNIVCYADSGKQMDELLNFKNSIYGSNFCDFVTHYDEIKEFIAKYSSKYTFSFDGYTVIEMRVDNKDKFEYYRIADFANISSFNINDRFNLFRFRRDTNRFIIDYEGFYESFEVELTDESYAVLDRFINSLRGKTSAEVTEIFNHIIIDKAGLIVPLDDKGKISDW